MSSEKVGETKDTEDSKPNPLPSVLKTKSKDAVNEETNKSKRVVFQEKPVIINKTVSKNGENTKNESSDFDKQKEKKDRVRPPTKVVVRRLPPTMTLDVFVDLVSPLPEHDFIYFVPADMSLGSNAFSRVYINFVNMADLLTFHEQFDNYVFMDNKGNEYPAVVEFAQFQRIPKKRQGKKRDLKAGTLKDDPEYIAFLETLREKKEANSSKQTIDVVVPPDKPAPKITTTPLLEYIKQRRAEQQKLRDEKREERRRKEMERKRIKDEEKKRRKDGESVLKQVLRSHETEDNEDNKSGKEVKEKEWSPLPQGPPSSKRREDDKLKQREEKKKERPVPDNRTRDVKSRESGPKSYRDERQKLAEGRIHRKLLDDQRKKVVNERNQNTKSGDAHSSQELDKSVSSKDTHPRKSYKEMRDIDRKGGSERHSSKDDKNIKESENRRSYRENEGRRHDRYTYGKDGEHKRSGYGNEHRRSSNSHSESETRKKSIDSKVQEKDVSAKKLVDDPGEPTDGALEDKENKEQCHEETEQEAVSGVEDNSAQLDIVEGAASQQDNKKSVKRSSSVGGHGSNQSSQVKANEKIIVDIKTKAGQSLKRSNSLDFTNVCIDSNSKGIDTVLHEKTDKPDNLLTEETVSKNVSRAEDRKTYQFDDNNEQKGSTNPENGMLLPDCGENDTDSHNINTDEEAVSCKEEKEQTLDQENGENQDQEADSVQNINENEMSAGENCELRDDQSVNKSRDVKSNDSSVSSTTLGNASGNITESESKRDPRAERRIRNKDRPSIEIYRPGMGRFSMQRKEREKSAVTGSSLEQDSPSTSPSPSPSLRPISASRSRAGQELRSMTFKRSVSREK
ncbi:trichohyalin-like isoform X1 [Schistocerca gregaria]|uniref:trichohyalin-like isoform X1 n=1 Tax=Schistocerca gregaria TaxID=7010 RepID=UPI00211EFA82|nr:trichohyalin-like isoform X1 [Schistocerca gregaria]